MYKNVVRLEIVLSVESEDTLSTEELENLVSELDYEFSSEYGQITTRIEEAYYASFNKLI